MRTFGEWDNQPTLSLPLRFNGQEQGQLSLGGRRNGQPYTNRDREVLQAVLDEVAVAMHTTREGRGITLS